MLSIDNYGYITNERLVYNEYFGFKEKEYYYKDIVEVETSFSSNSGQNEYNFSYTIKTKDKEIFDILKAGSEVALCVNAFLVKENVEFNKATIPKELYQRFKNVCSKIQLEAIETFFTIGA